MANSSLKNANPGQNDYDDAVKKSLTPAEVAAEDQRQAAVRDQYNATAQDILDREFGGTKTDETEKQERDKLGSPGFYRDEPKKSGLKARLSPKGKDKSDSGNKNQKRLLFGAFGGVGVCMVAGLFILLFLLSSLKIQHLVENVTAWNMARSARAFNESVQQNTNDAIAEEAFTDQDVGTLIRDGGFTPDIVKNVLDKIDTYRPGKLTAEFQENLTPKYAEGGPRKLLPGNQQVFQGWEDQNGNLLAKPENTSLFSLSPVEGYTNKLQFAGEVDALVAEQFPNVNSLVRGQIVKNFLDEQGIHLFFWDRAMGPYQDASQAKAEELAQSTLYDDVHDNNTSDCLVSQVCEASSAANDQVASDVQAEASDTSGNAVGAAAQESQIAQNAAAKISSTLSTSGVQDVVSTASGIAGVVTPLCLVYDGSVENSGKTIDATETSDIRTYASTASAAAQQQVGDSSVNSAKVGGLNGVLGDITPSVPIERADGDTANLTASLNPSALPQSDGTGQYSLITVFLSKLGFPSLFTNSLDGLAKSSCPVLTDFKTQIGLAAINVGLGITTLGSDEVAIEGGEEAVQPFFTALTDSIATETGLGQAFTQAGGGVSGSWAASKYIADAGGEFVVKTGLFAAGTIGATELAKLIVLKHMNAVNNGLATGATLANQVDMGGNLMANETCRQVLYCAPLVNTQVVKTNYENLAYLQNQVSNESIMDRYFSIHNSSSLVSHLGDSMLGYMQGSSGTFMDKLLSGVSSMFNGGALRLFSTFTTNHNKVLAASTDNSGDYNIVQWGYTTDEENLINNDPSYSPINNAIILAESNQATAIQNKYGKCFTESMGDMLSGTSPDLVRNQDGSVDPNNGLCSPNNLGLADQAYGPNMVFRWRLAQRNTNVLNHLVDLQNASGS